MHRAFLRKLLTAAFPTHEFEELCFDEYRDVSEIFAGGMNRSQQIRLLIEHVEKRSKLYELLKHVKERNQTKYREFIPPFECPDENDWYSDSANNLPLPLAQLYARAQNATDPISQHERAFHLWQATIKLVACLTLSEIAEFAKSDRLPPSFIKSLEKKLRAPSINDWLEISRNSLDELSDREIRPFENLKLHLFGESLVGVQSTVSEFGSHAGQLCQRQLSAFGSFGDLERYGKEIVDASASVSTQEHKEHALGLLQRHANIFSHHSAEALANRPLFYIHHADWDSEGRWWVVGSELKGLAPQIKELEIEVSKTKDKDRLPKRGQVYAVCPERDVVAAARGVPDTEAWIQLGRFRLLNPLVYYDQEQGDFYFFHLNEGRQVEYLSFFTGMRRTQSRSAVLRPFFARLRGENLGQDTGPPSNPKPSFKRKGQRKYLGDFELIEEIGSGGMGKVHRAYQETLKKHVALKVLAHTGDKVTIVRFKEEVASLARVDHPNVVKVFYSGNHNNKLYYAMELIEGWNLQQIWEYAKPNDQSHENTVDGKGRNEKTAVEPPPKKANAGSPENRRAESTEDSGREQTQESPKKTNDLAQMAGRLKRENRWVAEIIRQVAEAAHAIHKAEIIHRDIKPNNIMITRDGQRGVLMDLGVAKVNDQRALNLTQDKIIGTPRYASPQQLNSKLKPDIRNDVYSIGATLWELLTLVSIFDGDMEMGELIERIQRKPPELIRVYRPTVPMDLEAIAMKCLEKDPDDRFQDASALAGDLQRWLNGDAVLAPTHTRFYRLRKHLLRYKRRYHAAAVALLALLMTFCVGIYYIAHYAFQAVVEREQKVAALDDFMEIAREAGENREVPREDRRKMLARVQKEYQTTFSRHGDDPAFVAKYMESFGRVHILLGEVAWEEGDLTLAEHHFTNAFSLWAKLKTNPIHDRSQTRSRSRRIELALLQLDTVLWFSVLAEGSKKRNDIKPEKEKESYKPIAKSAISLRKWLNQNASEDSRVQLALAKMDYYQLINSPRDMSFSETLKRQTKLKNRFEVILLKRGIDELELARVNYILGHWYLEIDNNPARAKNYLLAAEKSWSGSRRRYSDEQNYADNCRLLGLATEESDPQKARQLYKTAAERFKKLSHGSSGKDLDLEYRSALCHYLAGSLAWDPPRIEESELNEAIRLWEEIEHFPIEYYHAKQLLGTYSGESEYAKRMLLDAIDGFGKRNSSTDRRASRYLAETHAQLSMELKVDGDYSGADKHIEEAVSFGRVYQVYLQSQENEDELRKWTDELKKLENERVKIKQQLKSREN